MLLIKNWYWFAPIAVILVLSPAQICVPAFEDKVTIGKAWTTVAIADELAEHPNKNPFTVTWSPSFKLVVGNVAAPLAAPCETPLLKNS